MPERENSLSNDWNIESVSKSLNTKPDEIQDRDLGPGKRFQVGETRLDIYPSSSTTRLILPGLKLQIDSVDPPTTTPDSVIFSPSESSPLFLNLGRNGEVTLFAKTRTSSPEPVSAHTKPVPEPLPAEIQDNEEAKKEPRLSLSGRVGTKPSFRTTRKGTLVGGFALAVHEGDKTTWQNVKAFGERAQKLKDSLKKGDAVDVVGYLHERQIKTKSGGSRTAQEIYAVVITPR